MTAHMSMAIFLVQSANLNISPLNYFLLGGGGIQVIQQLYFLTHWSQYSLICVRKCQFYVFHQDHSQLPLIVACEIPSD